MINVNNFIINESLIKVAVPYFTESKDGIISNNSVPSTKIYFTDNTELVFEGLDIYSLFRELEKQTENNK